MPISPKLLSALAAAALSAAAAGPAAAAPAKPTKPTKPTAPAGFRLSAFARAPNAATTAADDIAILDGHVFVGWGNGLGPKGERNPKTGQTRSLVVEYGAGGRALRSWRLKGHVDGLAGDPAAGEVIATVNEDGNSSLYTIKPAARRRWRLRHYRFSPEPDRAATGGAFTGGGTDAVVVHDRRIYVSASAPSAKNATAAFRVRLLARSRVAVLRATFADDASATDGVSGAAVKLALTDPDSNADVPRGSPRFGGDFALVSQADQELVFAAGLQTSRPSLTRLSLTRKRSGAGVDDVRWAARRGGTLYVIDSGAGVVYRLRGPFKAGEAFASLDTVGQSADNTEVDTLNLATGALSPLVTGLSKAKGLVWGR